MRLFSANTNSSFTLFNEESDSLPQIFELLPNQEELLTTVVMYVSALSLCGSFLNIITTIVLKNYLISVGKLIIALSMMDAIACIGSFLDPIRANSQMYCNFISYLSIFGYIGSLFWTATFAFSLYSTVHLNTSGIASNNFKKYVLSSILLSLSYACVPVVINYYKLDKRTGYCVHAIDKDDEVDWKLQIVITFPSAICILFCLFCNLSVLRKLREFGTRMYFELLIIPCILIVCNAPSTIIELTTDPLKKNLPFYLILIQNILFNSQGFLNSIAYGLSRKNISGWKEKCRKRNRDKLDLTLSDSDDPSKKSNTQLSMQGSLLLPSFLQGLDEDER